MHYVFCSGRDRCNIICTFQKWTNHILSGYHRILHSHCGSWSVLHGRIWAFSILIAVLRSNQTHRFTGNARAEPTISCVGSIQHRLQWKWLDAIIASCTPSRHRKTWCLWSKKSSRCWSHWQSAQLLSSTFSNFPSEPLFCTLNMSLNLEISNVSSNRAIGSNVSLNWAISWFQSPRTGQTNTSFLSFL